MKKTIQSIVAPILIILLSVLAYNSLSSSKKQPKKNKKARLQSVIKRKVINSTLPVQIKSTGAVLAKNRTELYAEVTGVFLPTSKSYKPGVSYRKGEAMIRINNSEFNSTVQSQRISFKSLVISTLADIQFDYPNELSKWKNYSKRITSNRTLPKIPSTQNESFSNYLSGKAIFSTYYSIKNLETRLGKYVITAPFSGTLVSADVTPGTLVSPGQKLGEFIQPGLFELELNVNGSLTKFLKVGEKVQLSNIENSLKYVGSVTRINSKIDQASQTIQLYVQVSANNLNEGEYLEAEIQAQEVNNVFEIDRNLIVDQNNVFIVQDGVLKKVQVQIVHANKNTVLVKGLTNDYEITANPVPNGYDGMKVSVKN